MIIIIIIVVIVIMIVIIVITINITVILLYVKMSRGQSYLVHHVIDYIHFFVVHDWCITSVI